MISLLIVALAISVARAEPRTTAAVVVHKAGSAKARVVGKLPPNTQVTVEKTGDGAWIRIRATVGRKQIRGFVERSKVELEVPAPAAPVEDDSEDGFAAPSETTPRKTLETTVVRKRPGEKQDAVGTLAAGTVVKVEGEKGRWLKVRAGTVAGYLPRTTVSGPEVATDTTALETQPASAPPRPRTWRRPEHADSSLAVEATAASVLRADAKPDAAVLDEVARGARLVVVDATGVAGFIRVRDDKGREGWIARAHVGNGSAAAALAVEPTTAGPTLPLETAPVIVAPRRAERPAARRLAIRLDAGIGYRVLGMDFTSNGSSGLANYVASADASAADLDVDVTLRMPGRLVVGVDAQLGVSHSSPGLDYPGPSGPAGEIAFSTISVDAGLRAGMRVRKLFEIAVRAGVHYDAFMTSDIENAGTLPRERLLGSTLGARVDIVPPRTRVSATLHVDTFVLGGRRQTQGLEDGTSSTARAVWAGLTARYALARRVAVQAAYDFGRATTEWSGMSVRDPGVTSARRVDSTQLVQIGLSIGL